MEIIDGVHQLRGRPAEIPDCSRDELPEFFVQMGYKTGAEIGVYKGEYTRMFLDKGLCMYGIDAWQVYKNFDIPGRNFAARLDALHAHTRRYLADYLQTGQCQLVRKFSMDAVEDFADGSLDFVYIDGHHGFRYVAEDLFEWHRKVRSGGVVSGHDYALNRKDAHDPYVVHVPHVVNAWTNLLGLRAWWLLGTKEYKDGEKRDKWRSWMYIKP